MMPKRKHKFLLEATRPNLLSLVSKRLSFYRTPVIQNLIFKQDEIPEEEVNQIESNALSFLNKQIKNIF